ncbi:MAG: hypothetical protein NZ822_00530 [Patescibacteria group bacterium]|nr:hypothetical protein [Patescibacteria group bacterium]
MGKKFFSLDIGNRLLKLCISEEDESGKISLLTKFTRSADSFNNGEIIDQENFVNEVISPLKEVAYHINEDPKEIIVSFSSSYFNGQRTKGKVPVSEKYVTEEDIRKCFLLAKTSLLSSNTEILFEEPISYFFDGGFKIRDPLGMEARNLEVDLFVIQGFKPSLNRLRDFFKANDVKIFLIVPNPLPASYVVLPKKEKELGVILVDFGYKIFSFAIFQEGKLSFYQSVQFGLGDILEDLALDLGVNLQEIDAIFDQLKVEKLDRKTSKIKIGRQKYSYSKFINLIEKKLSFYWKKNNLNDIFAKIRENFRLPAGIYLIGGGAYIPEIENLLKRYTHYPIKIATDQNGVLSKEELIYANSLGMAYIYQKSSFNKNFWETIREIFLRIFK